MKKLTLSLLVTLFTSSFGFAQSTACEDMKLKLNSSSELFQYVENLAQYHVYYGSISTKKNSAIYNSYLVRECTQGKKVGGIVRFQVKAKNQTGLVQNYFCYSKFYINGSNRWFNNGTFCALSKGNIPSGMTFPYGTHSDPYANAGREAISDIDRPEAEFPGRNGGGLNDRQDPFYETRNDYGPDSRNDWVR